MGAGRELVDGLLCMAAFSLHVLRRLYECVFVHHRGSAATMNLAHYAFGSPPPTHASVTRASQKQQHQQQQQCTRNSARHQLSWDRWAGLSFYLAAAPTLSPLGSAAMLRLLAEGAGPGSALPLLGWEALPLAEFGARRVAPPLQPAIGLSRLL